MIKTLMPASFKLNFLSLRAHSACYLISLLSLLMAYACVSDNSSDSVQSPTWRATRFLKTEHDSDLSVSTQCLAWSSPDTLWQSSGKDRRSEVLKLTINETGLLQSERWSITDIFAEGCTVWSQFLILLSWRSFTVHVIDRTNGQELGLWPIATEGWGLSGSSRGLIYSDGSSTLRWIQPPINWDQISERALEIQQKLDVYDAQQPVFQLNELEWVEEFIFANVYPKDQVAMIDSQSGQVLAWLNLSPLRKQNTAESKQVISSGSALSNESQLQFADKFPEGVANGIAYDQRQKLIWFTGKHWPKVYGLDASSLLSSLRSLKEKASLEFPSSLR